MTEKCNVACSIGIAAEELRPRLRKRYTKEAFEEYLRQAVFEQNSYEKKTWQKKAGEYSPNRKCIAPILSVSHTIQKRSFSFTSIPHRCHGMNRRAAPKRSPGHFFPAG